MNKEQLTKMLKYAYNTTMKQFMKIFHSDKPDGDSWVLENFMLFRDNPAVWLTKATDENFSKFMKEAGIKND